MTPSEVIELIKKGNEQFCKVNKPAYFQAHKDRQNPVVTLLTCSDSRVHSAAVIPDPFNNVFSVENIGNQVSTCEGSLDYGILHLKTPVLLIVGHSDCGAVKAYEKGYSSEPAGIKKELDGLRPVFAGVPGTLFLKDRIIQNIRYQAESALERYFTQVEAGILAVVGAYYDLADDFQKGYGKLIIISINGLEPEP